MLLMPVLCLRCYTDAVMQGDKTKGHICNTTHGTFGRENTPCGLQSDHARAQTAEGCRTFRRPFCSVETTTV